MRPRVIMHNSISADGAVGGFDVDMGLHYQLLASYGAGAHLVGSHTAKAGVEMEGEEQPPEEDGDRAPPTGREDVPLWVFVDSKGALEGLLHHYRRFEHCREAVVLVCESTPESYLTYLRARAYPFFCAGADRVDLVRSLEWLAEEYDVDAVITDAGASLNAALLAAGLVDELSLVLWPVLVGSEPIRLVGPLPDATRLELQSHAAVGGGQLWLRYDVVHTPE